MSWAEAKWLVDKVVQKVGQCPNNMQSFTATQSSDTQVSLLFLEPEDSYSGESLICKVSGVMIRMSMYGYPKDISEGELVLDNKNLGAYRNEAYVVSGLEPGATYYFTAFPYSEQGVYNLSRDASNRACNCEPVPTEDTGIYGISRDITASSPEWARTDAAVGFSATASVGTVAGSSDFDTCYPWSGIQRETLSTGDVMVRIPKFYFQRYREGNIEHIRIADSAKPGFALHPAFHHAGVESDYLYVGAYETMSRNSTLLSASGGYPVVNKSRGTSRSEARAKGEGWGIMDISTLSAIQTLMLVEFATNDMQSALGEGRTAEKNTSSIPTGSCDNVFNLTGRYTHANGDGGVIYRGIENPWGNVWEWIDGLNYFDKSYYISNDPSKYADDTASGYELLSFTCAAGLAGAYITEHGLDNTSNIHVFLPAAASGGSSSTYMCDSVWTGTDWKVFAHGCYWGHGSRAGLLASSFLYKSNDSNNDVGFRLLYIPQ